MIIQQNKTYKIYEEKKEIYSVELQCTDLVLCVHQYSDKKLQWSERVHVEN